MLKSEVEDLRVQYEKEMQALIDFVESKIAPVRKSVQYAYEYESNGTTVSMSDKDIDQKLSQKMAQHVLHKSDRDLILGYRLGKVNIDQISHLLK